MHSTVTFGDLLKPSMPKLCTRRGHCANCARYLPEQVFGEEGMCRDCSRITECEMQLWECVSCDTLRIWGLSFPFEKSPKRLRCVGCGQITEHRFAYVTGRDQTRNSPLSSTQAGMRELSREVSPSVSDDVADANWRVRLKAAIWAH